MLYAIRGNIKDNKKRDYKIIILSVFSILIKQRYKKPKSYFFKLIKYLSD
jgi:hypothetical protein